MTSYVAILLKNPTSSIAAKVQPYALAGDNLKQTIPEDDIWYGRNIDGLLKKWNAWLVAG
jgi:hypothetical protein